MMRAKPLQPPLWISDLTMLGLCSKPQKAAQDNDNDVHVIGISSQAAGHKTWPRA